MKLTRSTYAKNAITEKKYSIKHLKNKITDYKLQPQFNALRNISVKLQKS